MNYKSIYQSINDQSINQWWINQSTIQSAERKNAIELDKLKTNSVSQLLALRGFRYPVYSYWELTWWFAVFWRHTITIACATTRNITIFLIEQRKEKHQKQSVKKNKIETSMVVIISIIQSIDLSKQLETYKVIKKWCHVILNGIMVT